MNDDDEELQQIIEECRQLCRRMLAEQRRAYDERCEPLAEATDLN